MDLFNTQKLKELRKKYDDLLNSIKRLEEEAEKERKQVKKEIEDFVKAKEGEWKKDIISQLSTQFSDVSLAGSPKYVKEFWERKLQEDAKNG